MEITRFWTKADMKDKCAVCGKLVERRKDNMCKHCGRRFCSKHKENIPICEWHIEESI